uniref:Zeta-sarcoglycan n=1 Tax=Parastrongyloides trichosuri TaxID=131310 RepID=A0A0N4Z515_PARTI
MERFTPYHDDPVWSRGINQDPYKSIHPFHNSFQQLPHGEEHTTVIHSSIKPIPDSDIYKVGIYGWRKRCLYVFILLLTIVIVINLALTIWIMNVLDFSTEGMGAFKIVKNGIKVEGKSQFEKSVQLSQLSTDNDDALLIDSSMGVLINAHNISGSATSSLNLDPDGKATAICKRFEVFSPERKLLFFVDSNEIGLKLDNLRILDDGGSIFEGAIQTAVVRPEPDTPLSLESPTRNLKVEAAQDIELLSSAGEIVLSSLLDIQMKTKNGEIHMDSSNIYINGLERASGQGHSQYQLCICQNGKLFMATERADCRADRSICE